MYENLHPLSNKSDDNTPVPGGGERGQCEGGRCLVDLGGDLVAPPGQDGLKLPPTGFDQCHLPV